MNHRSKIELLADWEDTVNMLKPEERGELLSLFFQYNRTGIIPESLAHEVRMVFLYMKPLIDNPPRTHVKKESPPMVQGDLVDYINQQGTETLTLSQENTDEKDFDTFWKYYPQRDGRKLGKADAKKAYMKIPKTQRENVLIAVDNYIRSGQIPRDAKRFLRDGSWQEWLLPAEVPLSPCAL